MLAMLRSSDWRFRVVNRSGRIIFSLVTLYVSWMAMMAVHESGHVLAGLAGGGRVRRVVLPFTDFSRTDIDPNPSPRLEVWGGPVWGSVFPLAVWLILRRTLIKSLGAALGFFTGLCLVANGAYLGMDWTMSAGDAAQLIKLGTPIWMLVAFGVIMIVPGLYIWHKIGQIESLFKTPGRVEDKVNH
jgi:hypothetical protein